MTDLSNPDIDWTKLARSMGIPGVRVEDSETLCKELERALATPGPNIIEMML